MPRRLLYVDDDRLNVLLFEELCRVAGGIEVQGALSGREALELARDFHPEVLVIDLHLPDTTGYALLGALRAEAGLDRVPAFLCSAEDPADVRDAAHAAGFDGCWAKPVDAAALRAGLDRLPARP
jgi:two-component system, OmpR family, response regulator